MYTLVVHFLINMPIYRSHISLLTRYNQVADIILDPSLLYNSMLERAGSIEIHIFQLIRRVGGNPKGREIIESINEQNQHGYVPMAAHTCCHK